MTNKYAKILVDDFDTDPPQMHGPVVSSATNKIKKSFNFETNALMPSNDLSSIENQSAGKQELSGASRTKK